MEQRLRDIPCFTCSHSTSERNNEVFCDFNEMWVPISAAYRCEHYEKAPHIKEYLNEFPIRNMVDGIFKTEKQWVKAGYRLKKDAIGIKMYPSKKAALISRENYHIYYSEKEVEKA